MDLFSFFRKKVELIDDNNKKWIGVVETFTPAIDTDDELYDEIALSICDGRLIGFNQTEIKEIKIVE
ncbi:MAG: hypothetical protein RSB67_04440 [Clostridia bacterium]